MTWPATDCLASKPQSQPQQVDNADKNTSYAKISMKGLSTEDKGNAKSYNAMVERAKKGNY